MKIQNLPMFRELSRVFCSYKIESWQTVDFWDKVKLMCAEKTGGFNLVNYRHSSGVYHEQETEDLHRRI